MNTAIKVADSRAKVVLGGRRATAVRLGGMRSTAVVVTDYVPVVAQDGPPWLWDSIPELWDEIPRTFDNF